MSEAVHRAAGSTTRRATALRRALLPLVTVLAVVAGCDSGDASEGASDGTARAESESTAGTASSSTSAQPSSTTAPATAADGSSTTAESVAPAGDWPTQLESLEHGVSAFGVYLAAVKGEDLEGEIAASQARAQEDGFNAGSGEVDCDQGAREALGLDPEGSYLVAAVYFATRAEAERFVELYEPEVVGIAEVAAYCAD